jgi:hypothetical protein
VSDLWQAGRSGHEPVPELWELDYLAVASPDASGMTWSLVLSSGWKKLGAGVQELFLVLIVVLYIYGAIQIAPLWLDGLGGYLLVNTVALFPVMNQKDPHKRECPDCQGAMTPGEWECSKCGAIVSRKGHKAAA